MRLRGLAEMNKKLLEQIYSPRVVTALYDSEPAFGIIPLWNKDAAKWKGVKIKDGWVVIPTPKNETIWQWLLRKVKL